MKAGHWFALVMLVFLGVMFVVEYNLPKKFVWNPTFSRYDKQPFGCAVFDDVVSNSWEKGYEVCNNTFYQLETDSVGEPLAILALAENLQFVKADKEAILRLAERGNTIILAATSFSLSDTLNYDMSYGWFRSTELKKYASSFTNSRDSLFWLPGAASYPAGIFKAYPHLCDIYFTKHDSLSIPLATSHVDSVKMRGDSLANCYPPVALRHPVGKGQIILISTPLLLTNYGMLDDNTAAYIFRLLSLAKDLPLYRTEAYNKEAHEKQSPFRYFLSQPGLRWALYLTFITLVLFMIFTARRRQRPIPVIRQPENKTLEFTELIGTLYYQKKKHGDLVRKKFVYFAEVLRRNIQVDVEDDSNDAILCRKIASKTGVAVEKVERLFRQLRPIVRGNREARENEMKELIDSMNEIVNRI